MWEKIENRVGVSNKNKQGDTMTITNYINARDVHVKFTTGEIVKCAYKEFKNGSVVSRFYPSVQGVGIYGLKEGKYIKYKFI